MDNDDEYPNNNGIYNNNPNSDVDATSAKVYKFTGTGSAAATGLGITIRVMSGDKIDILGKSFWTQHNNSGANQNLLLTDIIAGLLATPDGLATSKGAAVNGLATGPNAVSIPETFLNRSPNEGDTKPMAYINYILLDEQFQYVKSGFSRVGPGGSVKDHFADLQNIGVTQNGYLYVYCSNQSPVDVYFDNLQIVHTRGPLVEETHYYPFGLTMAGISSQALNFGTPENNKLYNKGSELQHKEFSDGSGLELYSTNFRSLDPQLGRWWQIDPKPDFAMSLYSAMGNNPILYNDPLGDTTNPRGQQLNINNQGMTSNSNITLNRIPKLERHPISTVNSIILHRTVSSSAASTLSSFASRGVGTHFLVGKDGTIYQTASLNSATSHLRESQIKKGFENIKNNTAIGIEVVGNYSENTKTWDAVTPEQASSTAFVVNSLEKTYSLTDDAIHNHEDVQPKTAGEGATVYKAIEPMLDSHNTITNDNQSSSGQYLSPHPSSLPAYFTNYLTPPNTDNN
jgi:RHS repeat-associated protein